VGATRSSVLEAPVTTEGPSSEGPSSEGPSSDAATLRVFAFVTASLVGHVAFAAVMPEHFELPPVPEPPTAAAVFFDVETPEPEAPPEEPVVEEEPLELPPDPPTAPSPPVRRLVDVDAPEPTRATEPPRDEPMDQPTDQPPGGDPEATDEARGETGEPQGTVVSTEGGLTVDRVAGSGQDGAAHGTLRRGSGTIDAPPPPTVDRRALARTWMIEVHRAIGRAIYTRSLLRAELEGRVVVALLVDAEGRVRNVRVARSSGEPMLDEAALEQLSRHERVPTPPAELAWRPREIQLPIVFELRERG
jgi:protein TonB